MTEKVQIQAPSSEQPEIYDCVTDIDRLNAILDKLTAKRFANAGLVIKAVRAALDLHGMTLPHLDVEGEQGPTAQDGPYIQANIATAAGNPLDMNSPRGSTPVEAEYLFKIIDADGPDNQAKGGNDKDNDDDLYLYIVIDLDEENLIDAYAQVVHEDEVDDLTDYNLGARLFPELVGDISGETKYEKQVRHTRDDED